MATLPDRFKRFWLYANLALCDGKYELYHLPRVLAAPSQPRFLRLYPNGSWELLHSKHNNAVPVERS